MSTRFESLTIAPHRILWELEEELFKVAIDRLQCHLCDLMHDTLPDVSSFVDNWIRMTLFHECDITRPNIKEVAAPDMELNFGYDKQLARIYLRGGEQVDRLINTVARMGSQMTSLTLRYQNGCVEDYLREVCR